HIRVGCRLDSLQLFPCELLGRLLVPEVTVADVEVEQIAIREAGIGFPYQRAYFPFFSLPTVTQSMTQDSTAVVIRTSMFWNFSAGSPVRIESCLLWISEMSNWPSLSSSTF